MVNNRVKRKSNSFGGNRVGTRLKHAKTDRTVRRRRKWSSYPRLHPNRVSDDTRAKYRL